MKPHTITAERLEAFEKAFAANSAGIVRTCDCGREFYAAGDTGMMEPGEEAGLVASNATPLDYNPGDIRFEGKEFVDACDCWHARAQVIIGFVLTHDRQIATLLALEAARLQRAAERAQQIATVAVLATGVPTTSKPSLKTQGTRIGASVLQ